MIAGLAVGAYERRLLPHGRMRGVMPWIIAVMVMMTALALGGALVLADRLYAIETGVAGRFSVQLDGVDPGARGAVADAAARGLKDVPGVVRVTRVPDADLTRIMTRWVGPDAAEGFVLPILFDVDLAHAPDKALLQRLTASVAALAPDSRFVPHADALGPATRLARTLAALALGIAALAVLAILAVVLLAARHAFETHRATIELLHLTGASDGDIARLFQRRVALDALIGAAGGTLAAALILFVLLRAIAAMQIGLWPAAAAWSPAWLALLALPPLTALAAGLMARGTALHLLARTV